MCAMIYLCIFASYFVRVLLFAFASICRSFLVQTQRKGIQLLKHLSSILGITF